MSRALTWIDSTGHRTTLDGTAGIIARADPIGLEAANVRNVIDDLVGFDGGVLVNRARPVRQIAMPLYLEHGSRVESVVSDLATMLQGPGQIEFADAAETRTLRQVIYEAGIDGSGISTLLERSLVVSLIALDPWWYGQTVTVAVSLASGTAFSAAITFSNASGFDGGDGATLVVPGDGETWPVFTITGPATTLGVTSGDLSWEIAVALIAGDTLVVDHRPGSRGPSLNGAGVDWSLLSEASRLFALPTGTAFLRSGSTGTTGATSITLDYDPRYLTP